jgi:hypothetical protein
MKTKGSSSSTIFNGKYNIKTFSFAQRRNPKARFGPMRRLMNFSEIMIIDEQD